MKKLLAILFGLTLFPTAILAYDCSDTVTSGVPEIQCDALVRFYNELGGNNWTNNTNWLVDATAITSRDGVTVQGGNITGVNLQANSLSGNLSSRIGLEEVIDLNLYNNEITQIPISREGLDSLTSMEIGSNPYTSIPTNRSGLSNLSLLNIRHTEVPQQFPNQNINNLGTPTLMINNSKFYGDIPDGFINFGADSIIHNNYFNTGNVEEPLRSHLDANFIDSRDGTTREQQNKAFTIFFPTIGFFNRIQSIQAATYTNIEIDCNTSTKTNATTIAGGYDTLVDKFCGDNTEGSVTINMKKFK